MKPEDLAKSGTEHGHQMAVFQWANQHKEEWPELVWLYAIANGGERNIIVAASLKAEGVKAGVSDTCLPVSRRGYHGLYIEMKKPKGKESPEQKAFGAFLTTQGYLYRCCDDWMKAATTLAWYMGRDDGSY